MKTRLSALIAALTLLASSAFADSPTPDFELVGIMGVKPDLSVAVRDNASRKTEWLQVGGSFNGFVVSGITPSVNMATFTKAGHRFALRLNDSKVVELKAPVPKPGPQIDFGTSTVSSSGDIDPKTLHDISSYLRQLQMASAQYFVETGKTSVTTAELVGPTGYLKRIVSVAGEDYSKLSLTLHQTNYSVTTSNGATVTVKVKYASDTN